MITQKAGMDAIPIYSIPVNNFIKVKLGHINSKE
jgi:hypothetical protein